MRRFLILGAVFTSICLAATTSGFAASWYYLFNPGDDLSGFTVVNPTGLPSISLTTAPGKLDMHTPARAGGFFNGFDLAQQVNYDALRMYHVGGGEPFTLETSLTTTASGSSQHTRLSGLYLYSSDGNYANDLVYGVSNGALKLDRGNGDWSIAPWMSIGLYPEGVLLQVTRDATGLYQFSYRKAGDPAWTLYHSLSGFAFDGLGIFTKTWKESSAPASPEVNAYFDYLSYNFVVPEPAASVLWVLCLAGLARCRKE